MGLYNRLLESIPARKEYYLGGYASSLNVLAETARNNNFNDVKFKAAILFDTAFIAKSRCAP